MEESWKNARKAKAQLYHTLMQERDAALMRRMGERNAREIRVTFDDVMVASGDGGRRRRRRSVFNRGGPNEECTAAVPTYISLDYVCYSYLHHPIGSNIIPVTIPHESHKMSRVNRKKYITK